MHILDCVSFAVLFVLGNNWDLHQVHMHLLAFSFACIFHVFPRHKPATSFSVLDCTLHCLGERSANVLVKRKTECVNVDVVPCVKKEEPQEPQQGEEYEVHCYCQWENNCCWSWCQERDHQARLSETHLLTWLHVLHGTATEPCQRRVVPSFTALDPSTTWKQSRRKRLT